MTKFLKVQLSLLSAFTLIIIYQNCSQPNGTNLGVANNALGFPGGTALGYCSLSASTPTTSLVSIHYTSTLPSGNLQIIVYDPSGNSTVLPNVISGYGSTTYNALSAGNYTATASWSDSYHLPVTCQSTNFSVGSSAPTCTLSLNANQTVPVGTSATYTITASQTAPIYFALPATSIPTSGNLLTTGTSANQNVTFSTVGIFYAVAYITYGGQQILCANSNPAMTTTVGSSSGGGATTCPASTLSGCSLNAANVGQTTSGSCTNLGTCSYTCSSSGIWTPISNTCHNSSGGCGTAGHPCL